MANDLIHLNSLKKNIQVLSENLENTIGINGRLYVAADVIEKAFELTPVVEEKTSEWIPIKENSSYISTVFECSECGRTVELANDYFGKPSTHISKYYPYCHCGCKMSNKLEE